LKPIKTIQGRHGSWTITDANLSPDNQWMIYSSITPYVHLVPTKQEMDTGGRRQSDNQVMLDFSNHGDDNAGVRWRNGVRQMNLGALEHFVSFLDPLD
jgi:WD repeat-containing protein 23